MDSEHLAQVTAAELARLIASKKLSPVAVTEAYLERIDRFDSQLNAYITVCRQEALQAAQEAEQALMRNNRLGSLHGLPFGVKDQLTTKGILTTAGSKILADYVPEDDATVITRMKAAGAILLGKQSMSAFAAGTWDYPEYGEAKNPWNRERNAGGSSYGSAIAVAASLCAISLGEDTGGSIRWPASHTGLVGLRPTWGRVSRYGLLPASWSLDTIGPITRTVEDAALVMNVIAGYDPKDPLTSKLPVPDYTQSLKTDLRGIRVGLIQEYMEEKFNDPEVLQAVRVAADQLKNLGAVVQPVSLPLLAQADTVMFTILGSDAAFVHREWLRTRPEEFGQYLRRTWLAASLLPARVLQKAARVRAILRREWLKLFDHFDVLLSPTWGTVAQKIQYVGDITSQKEVEQQLIWHRLPTLAASLAGTPALTIPCGLNSENLPIGMQIMGNRFHEEMVFNVGYAYEQRTTWHKRRPIL